MPPKKRGTRKQKRKQQTLYKVESISHSDSTTNQNDQSESWECPLSARRNLTPNTTVFSDRRCSLRSSARLIETGISSLSGCSQPQKVRGHSSSTDGIQVLGQDPTNTTNSAYKVPKGSLAESPSRNLVQVAHSLTLKPEIGHKEAENVGTSKVNIPEITEIGHKEAENSNVNIPETMEEVGETEKSLFLYSNQMHKHNAFEAECVPLEQETLAVEIQASNIFEEMKIKNHRKPISMARYSSSSFSLKLTEMVALGDDEADSGAQSCPKDTVNGYQVKPEFMPILRKIIDKHGDIAKNCVALTMKYRSVLLEMICDIVSELEKKDITKIKEDVLNSKIALVNEIKITQVEVEWLHMRLIELLEARSIIGQFGMLKNKIDNNKKTIETAESALEECEAQKKELSDKLRAICERETVCKEALTKAKDESTSISQTVKYAKSKVRPFLNCSLVDGLL
ncbi:uncharacterized protein [Cicer arietinum]|uniref:Uncharacterized protein LOC101496882 isoform X1 n=1 Tax=Cicer arietinum TaxID=3827 RepID=A0A1S2YIW3_CICAR|nr:uncharacterized protein LOC101496882 isoform X1 [Cicer arietinum]XP_004505460.1 uncharacterized protein LOC101496882 isoform X1 [Cicer arietinum]XP_012572620.1 uncharacterized protein LOC101496882 isoform X1 [Cicer arietinum]